MKPSYDPSMVGRFIIPLYVAKIGLGSIVPIGNGVIAVNSERRLRSLVRTRFASESPCATQSREVQIILLIAGCGTFDFRIGSHGVNISWLARRYSLDIGMWIVLRACEWLQLSSIGSWKGWISLALVISTMNLCTLVGGATVAWHIAILSLTQLYISCHCACCSDLKLDLSNVSISDINACTVALLLGLCFCLKASATLTVSSQLSSICLAVQ